MNGIWCYIEHIDYHLINMLNLLVSRGYLFVHFIWIKISSWKHTWINLFLELILYSVYAVILNLTTHFIKPFLNLFSFGQILGSDSGWQSVPLTDLITATAVKKAYRKATLCVHPDKVQQRGATIRQKYICEKVFDLLKVCLLLTPFA
jgi:hypothetical protein